MLIQSRGRQLILYKHPWRSRCLLTLRIPFLSSTYQVRNLWNLLLLLHIIYPSNETVIWNWLWEFVLCQLLLLILKLLLLYIVLLQEFIVHRLQLVVLLLRRLLRASCLGVVLLKRVLNVALVSLQRVISVKARFLRVVCWVRWFSRTQGANDVLVQSLNTWVLVVVRVLCLLSAVRCLIYFYEINPNTTRVGTASSWSFSLTSGLGLRFDIDVGPVVLSVRLSSRVVRRVDYLLRWFQKDWGLNLLLLSCLVNIQIVLGFRTRHYSTFLKHLLIVLKLIHRHLLTNWLSHSMHVLLH